METTLANAVESLREGAKGRYVYRGQTKEYLSPLVPSLFRPTVSSDTQHIPWFGETLRAINSACSVCKGIAAGTSVHPYHKR
jgi:hypothetical protein